jgi:metal-responsive CopG/Arc/MetJ family transcriptional regulator
MTMRRRITISLDEEVASYLDSVPNRSRVVAEAVRDSRARRLERELEAAYGEDRDETCALATEWKPGDAGIDE